MTSSAVPPGMPPAVVQQPSEEEELEARVRVRVRVVGARVGLTNPSPNPKEEELEAAMAELEHRGLKVAAFMADSIFSSDGIFADPPGFLRPAVEAVQARGGLYIADEVQPGFARSGTALAFFVTIATEVARDDRKKCCRPISPRS